jgi:hypothetical protein
MRSWTSRHGQSLNVAATEPFSLDGLPPPEGRPHFTRTPTRHGRSTNRKSESLSRRLNSHPGVSCPWLPHATKRSSGYRPPTYCGYQRRNRGGGKDDEAGRQPGLAWILSLAWGRISWWQRDVRLRRTRRATHGTRRGRHGSWCDTGIWRWCRRRAGNDDLTIRGIRELSCSIGPCVGHMYIWIDDCPARDRSRCACDVHRLGLTRRGH